MKSLLSKTATKMKIGLIEKVAAASLFVSEPSPGMFGNPGNVKKPTWTNENWLKSRFHFSFAEYYDPKKSNFGVLRVMNDDLVQPERGFGEHPHRDMEIVTYIVEGELTHQDSSGNKESLGRGAVQYMTAGTGVYHSERNDLSEKPTRFIQMWITPTKRDLPVNYGGYKGDASARKAGWQHLVTGVNAHKSTPIKINQDTNIYVSEVDAGSSISFSLQSGRQAYFLAVESEDSVIRAKNSPETETTEPSNCQEVSVNTHDAARIYGPLEIEVVTKEATGHFLIVEMQQK